MAVKQIQNFEMRVQKLRQMPGLDADPDVSFITAGFATTFHAVSTNQLPRTLQNLNFKAVGLSSRATLNNHNCRLAWELGPFFTLKL